MNYMNAGMSSKVNDYYNDNNTFYDVVDCCYYNININMLLQRTIITARQRLLCNIINSTATANVRFTISTHT
jgi:hypothetical protein